MGKQFTIEQLRQKNIYVSMVTGAGLIFFSRTAQGTWEHSRFGYEMSTPTLLDEMNSGLWQAKIRKIDIYGMNDML